MRLHALLALLALVPVASAQTLRHVRVSTPDAERQALEWLRAGLDVLEGSVQPGSLELVLSVEELDRLIEQGESIQVLARGRPYREIQAESHAEGVPAGYADLSGIVSSMSATASAFPSIAQLVDVTATYGTPSTFEGNHLMAMKISDNVGSDEDEHAVLVVSAHHSRELVTPVIALEAIDQLTSQYGTDPTITSLVDDFEIWIAPLWNPDGYEYVFDTDNLWRKNRFVFLTGVGVDLNRNYPFGWSSSCSGSSSVSSTTYKGPTPASEAETQAMLALHGDRHFAFVGDFHSFGSEVRYGYGCDPHPFTAFMQTEAAALSTASGYAGATGPSCCLGGQIHTPLATMGSYSFLWETALEFQPTFTEAQAEAVQVVPGMFAMMQRPISLSGRVTDANTGAPIVADISLPGVVFLNGETNQSEFRFGRYHVFLPAGPQTVQFSAPGYTSQLVLVNATPVSAQVTDVMLGPTTITYCTGKTNSLSCVPFMSFAGLASASDTLAFSVRANDLLPNQSGLFIYGVNGPSNLNFHGGKLCVKSPLVRLLPPKNSGSGATPPCSGLVKRNFNSRIQSGVDPLLTVGQQVNLQFLQRDSALGDGFNDSLTDGLQFVVNP